jgi:hypothetical protein
MSNATSKDRLHQALSIHLPQGSSEAFATTREDSFRSSTTFGQPEGNCLSPLLNQGPDKEPPAEPPYTRIMKGMGELMNHILASHRLVNPRNKQEARTMLATEGSHR